MILLDRRRTKTKRWMATLAILAAGFLGPGAHTAILAVSQGGDAGTLEVTFLYMPPTSIDPTYHTAMWLEDEKGNLIKTLYVSQELSSAEYKVGQACPDWVKKANWDKAPKSEVDAVTAPTPNVGSESKEFDLGKLGIKPGIYRFNFQVHVTDQYNVLHRGTLRVGPESSSIELEIVTGPGKAPVADEFVRNVRARYVAPAK